MSKYYRVPSEGQGSGALISVLVRISTVPGAFCVCLEKVSVPFISPSSVLQMLCPNFNILSS